MAAKRASTLSKDAWIRLAEDRLAIARQMHWFVDCSTRMLLARFADREALEELPGIEEEQDRIGDLMDAACARGSAEAQAESEEPEFEFESTSRSGIFERELYVLLNALSELADRHVRKVDLYLSMAQDVKRGRPKKRLPGRGDWPGLAGSRLEPKRGRSGRKRLVDVPDRALLAAITEGKRQGLPTERAALENLVRQHLSENGKHTVGGRVDAMIRNLQKRVSELRLAIRKSDEKLRD